MLHPTRVFAPGFRRLENGLIEVPRDTKIRDAIWPENVGRHPAKYSCHLVITISQYLTEPGQTILDPMSGTGTTMIAAIEDRAVICIEVEEKYYAMQEYALEKLIQMKPDADIMLLLGDCNKLLPLPADCIIFSPPYADQLQRHKVTGIAAEEQSSMYELADYSKSIWNIGKLNYFMYFQRMERIYKKLLDSAPIMAIVVKDRTEGFKRKHLVKETIKLCEKVGWQLVENILLDAPGTEFIRIHESHGEVMVKDESVLIMRRR